MTSAGRLFQRAVSFLVHGGAFSLRDYESRILEAAAASLSVEDRAALQAQLQDLEHLKRLHADRMVTFYFFDRARLPLLSERGGSFCLAAFELRAGSGSKLRASVFSHEGILSSLEFKQPPLALAKAEGFEVKLVARKAARSLSQSLDDEEHG